MSYTNGTFNNSSEPSQDYGPITPSDTVDFVRPSRMIIVATAGDVRFVKLDSTTATLTLPVGAFPIVAIRVNATGTTASGLSRLS